MVCIIASLDKVNIQNLFMYVPHPYSGILDSRNANVLSANWNISLSFAQDIVLIHKQIPK